MSIHQLTTLAGTASKPYLLRGNQQVTDQIHYGAAPAAGRSRAGLIPGMGGFVGKTSPCGYSGWYHQPRGLGKCLCGVKLSPFARERNPGRAPDRSQRRMGPHQHLVLAGCLRATASARSLSGKGHLMPPEMSALERRDSLQMDRQQLLFFPKTRSWGKSCPCIRRTGYFPLPLKFCLALVGLSFQIIASKNINLFLRLLRSRHLARFSAITKA